MSTLQIWLVVAGMTLVTAATRAFFLLGGERGVLPERLQRALRYAPAAALVAYAVIFGALAWRAYRRSDVTQ